MSRPGPLVSVLMPTYNVDRFVSTAIASVLKQTFSGWELLICDDGSKDNTVEVVRAMARLDGRIRVRVSRENQGVAKTRQQLLELARGLLVCHVDSDDWIEPHALEVMVAEFAADPELALAYSDCARVNAKGELTSYRESKNFTSPKMCAAMGWNHLGMFRRQVAIDVGGYNTLLWTCSDGDLWMKIAQKHKIKRVPRMLYNYRSHQTNLGRRSPHDCKTCDKRPVCNYFQGWISTVKTYNMLPAEKIAALEPA